MVSRSKTLFDGCGSPKGNSTARAIALAVESVDGPALVVDGAAAVVVVGAASLEGGDPRVVIAGPLLRAVDAVVRGAELLFAGGGAAGAAVVVGAVVVAAW